MYLVDAQVQEAMFRIVLPVLVFLLAALPLAAHPPDAAAPPEIEVASGAVANEAGWPGWARTLIVKSPFPLYDRPAAGRMRLDPGFYEVHQLYLMEDSPGYSFFGGSDIELSFSYNPCGRRNQIIDNFHRVDLALNCEVTLTWELDADAAYVGLTIIRIEDWSVEADT